MAQSNKRNTFYEEVTGTTKEIISSVKRMVRKGNARRVMILNADGKILFQTALTAGVAGSALLVMIAPLVAALGTLAVVFSSVRVVVEKYDDADQTGESIDAEVIIEIEDEEEAAGKNS